MKKIIVVLALMMFSTASFAVTVIVPNTAALVATMAATNASLAASNAARIRAEEERREEQRKYILQEEVQVLDSDLQKVKSKNTLQGHKY